MPQADPVADRLRRAPVAPSLRADAWDAFHAATDADDLTRRISALKIPDDVKADLWDLKVGNTLQTPATPRQPGLATIGEQVESKQHPHARVGDSVANFARGAWNVLNPVAAVKGLVQASNHPVDAIGAIGEAQGRVGQGAADALKQGDYVTAARKGINYLLPVVGPQLDAAADKMMAGDYMEGAGEAVALGGTIGSMARPRPVPAVSAKRPIMAGPANATEAAAVEFARQQGIPLDLGTATGRQLIKNTQKRVGNTIAGEAPAIAMQTAQAKGLARVGDELAVKAGPSATNPVASGESVRGALTKRIQELHAVQDSAYGRLRQFEQRATPDMVRARNTGAGPDDFVDMPLAVDLRSSKADLRPVYDRLLKKKELTGQLMGAEGRAAVALDSLLAGPDFAPLSVVDAALGDIKALARGADMPELRTSGQGIAAQAVKTLDDQVRTRAHRAGADVLKALEDGRGATKQKYDTADVLDMLSAEPRQVFNQLTQAKDAGVARLREVQRVAPGEMPNVARAFLEDIMEQAKETGGFDHADRLMANWQKLGSETKARLFPNKGQVADLDNFFLLAKKIKENPNPSGTAQVLASPKLNVMEALAFLPSKALAKILYNPEAVKALTTARYAARGPGKASQALAASQVARAAQSAGVSLEAIPALAGPRKDQSSLSTPEPFNAWYSRMAARYDLNPNPDDPAQFYDYRAAHKAGAAPDSTGHWPSQFKREGHPQTVVGGFNVKTGERVPGTKRASESELIELGWDPETAKSLARKPEPSTRSETRK